MLAQHAFGGLAALHVLTRLTWSIAVQMRYLLFRPLTHPIYVLKGVFPGDSPYQ